MITLWPLERGLTVAETLLAFSLMGFVVFVLELPTSGFADAFGRRPVLVAAAVVNVVAACVLILGRLRSGSSPSAAALQGVFRALDSGPLEAWFVDTVHVTEPGADVDRTLAAQGTVLGGSIAVGAVVSGGLVCWDPLRVRLRAAAPVPVLSAALNVVHLLAVVILLKEPRTHVDATGARRARRLRARGARRDPRRPADAAAQQGAARHRPGRGLLVHRDGRLRVLPADPARRDASAARSRRAR